jgi:phenylpyruvate tautomerase PptA (4-oxalocrotonate tautomerase family)
MPTARLTLPDGAWSKEEYSELITAITDAIVSVGRKHGKPENLAQFVNVHITTTDAGGYGVGGQVAG